MLKEMFENVYVKDRNKLSQYQHRHSTTPSRALNGPELPQTPAGSRTKLT